MGKLTSRLVVVASALVATGALVPTGGRAQPAPASHGAPRDAVADEVALLRQSVERLAALAVKSQVLAARLAAQQQQVVREQDAIAHAEDAIDAAGRRQELTRATLARLNNALGNVVEEPRSELRRQVESLGGELADQDRELNRLRTRLSNAEQSLKSRQQSCADLDDALGSLVRQVERPKP
jgi:chromosome segregation ATPase